MTFIGPAILYWSVDLAVTDGGFVDGGETGQWAWGEVVAGPSGSGPVWATKLDGPYLNDTEDWLEITLPDLSGVALPSLVLTHWYAVREGDQAIVQVDVGDGVWTRIDPAYGYPDPDGFVGVSTSYEDVVFDLSPYGTGPRVRLLLIADPSQSDLGWYLSDAALWDGDVLPPTVSVVSPPEDTQDLVGPYEVQAQILDDRAVVAATLWYTVNGGVPSPLAMSGVPATAAIPGQSPGSTVELWVEASDGQNLGRWPVAGQHTFRVFLAAPRNVELAGDMGVEDVGAAARPVAQSATLVWEPPESPHTVQSYRVVREGEWTPLVTTTKTTATVPLEADDAQRFLVYALYDVGLSDPSDPIDLDIEVPVLDPLAPASALPGDDVVVHLSGQSLYLVDDVTTVALGSGIEVLAVDVLDVGEAIVTAYVPFGAAPGPRDVTISGPSGTFLFPGAFTVADPEDVRRIVAMTPERLTQGSTVTFVAESSVPWTEPVSFVLDRDLDLVGTPGLDGVLATFVLAANEDAIVGWHTVAIDDGTHLHTVQIEVEAARSSLTTCATAPGGAPWVVGLGLFALRRRKGFVPWTGHRKRAG